MFQGGIDELSVELLADIFDRLEDDDLTSVSSVCKYWFDVVNHYLLQRKQAAILRPELSDFKPDWLLNKLSLIGFDGDQFERLPDSIHLKDLHWLHVGYEDSWGHNLDELALMRLIDSCESLKILSFKNVALTDSLISYILNHCFNSLDSLTFDCCYFLDGDTVTKTLNQSHFLEFKLIVRDSFSEQLSVYAHYPFYYKTISNIGLPKYLTRLQMDCSGLTEDSFKCLRHCHKLHTLQLLNAFNVDDEAVVTFTRLPELRKISFSDAKKISSIGWRTLFSCAKFVSVVLVRCVMGLCDSAFENASAASKCLDLDLQNCKRVTGEGLATVLLLPERLSLSLDYGEELIDRLVSFLTLGLAPRLRCLDIVVQRLHATSVSVSSHLSKVKRTLLRHSNRHHIRFTFKERFTRVECIYQPSSAISL